MRKAFSGLKGVARARETPALLGGWGFFFAPIPQASLRTKVEGKALQQRQEPPPPQVRSRKLPEAHVETEEGETGTCSTEMLRTRPEPPEREEPGETRRGEAVSFHPVVWREG